MLIGHSLAGRLNELYGWRVLPGLGLALAWFTLARTASWEANDEPKPCTRHCDMRIKRFFGTSGNAIKSQVWIVVGSYVLVAIVKKRPRLDLWLHAMSRILSVTPFEKIPLFQLFFRRRPKSARRR